MTKEKIEQRIHENVEKIYNIGLNDAWECARKIYGMDRDTRMSAFVFNEYETVFDNYSAASAIEAIKEWEEKQPKKNCMNCGHMKPHYDTFRCNVMGKCLRREKWIPKRILNACDSCKYRDYTTKELPCVNCIGAEAWESDQIYDEIKVGDVVEVDGFTGLSRLLIVITVAKGAQTIRVMNAYGDNECVDASSVKKTGRSFPEIAKAIEQIQKEVEQAERKRTKNEDRQGSGI